MHPAIAAPSPPIKPCRRCGATERGVHRQCKPCQRGRQRERIRSRRQPNAPTPRQRRDALEKHGTLRFPTGPARSFEACRHARGKIDVATPAGVRTFRDVKIWPRGETLIVLMPRGERIVFERDMWSAACDRCDDCHRALTITPAKTATAAA